MFLGRSTHLILQPLQDSPPIPAVFVAGPRRKPPMRFSLRRETFSFCYQDSWPTLAIYPGGRWN
jgi:hypothetical protein